MVQAESVASEYQHGNEDEEALVWSGDILRFWFLEKQDFHVLVRIES